MSATPNFNLYPPAGYTHKDPDSGMTFSGGNWPEVVARLIAYRQANKLPLGKPEAEVFTAFCKAHPRYCDSGKTAKQFRALAVSPTGFASSIQSWIADAFSQVNRRKVGYISGSELEERAKICRRCPRQREWTSGCSSCDRNFNRVVTKILRKTPTVGRALLACSALREETSVSVHLSLPPVKNDSLPQHCWRRDKS